MRALRNLILTIHMLTLTTALAVRDRVTNVPERDRERGSWTLEAVLWTAAIATAAVFVVGVIVAAINSNAAKIPQ